MTSNGATGSATGRLEVLGNHTDYNQGLVLAMGVGFTMEVRGKKRDDHRLLFHAQDLRQNFAGSLDDLSPRPQMAWANYILGVLQGLKDRGVSLTGLKLEIFSHLPMGAGLSSSAALQATWTVLGGSRPELAGICHRHVKLEARDSARPRRHLHFPAKRRT